MKSAKWLDGGKLLFKMAIRLDSTILSSDPNVQQFLFHSREHLFPMNASAETDRLVVDGERRHV